MIGLPYGSRKVTSNGVEMEIQNTLRAMGNTDIIRLYTKRLRELEQMHLLLSESSMHRMLKACSAERRKSLHGVNSYLAEGSEVYFSLFIKLFRHFKIFLI